MPEDDPLAVEGSPCRTSSATRPASRLGRVDRIDEDPLGRREQPRGLLGVGRRHAIPAPERPSSTTIADSGTGAIPGSVASSSRISRDPRPQVLRLGWAAAMPRTRVGTPAVASPASSPPGCHRSRMPGPRHRARSRPTATSVGKLDPGEDLTRRARQRRIHRPADVYGRWPAARRSAVTRAMRGLTLLAVVRRRDLDRRPQLPGERDGRPRRIGGRPRQHEMDAETGPGTGRRGQPGVVRPPPARRDQVVGALGQRRADQELEIAQLVAAKRERQEVLALDPDLRTVAERGREARQTVERRGSVEQREARESRRIGRPGGHAAHGTRLVSSADGDPDQPSGPAHDGRPAPGHGTVDRHLGTDRRITPAVLLDRLDGPRRQDADPSPRRLRDLDLHRVRASPGTPGVQPGSSTPSTRPRATSSTSRRARSTWRRTRRATEPLVVVLTRNCPDSHVVYLDGGPDGADDVPAPC